MDYLCNSVIHLSLAKIDIHVDHKPRLYPATAISDIPHYLLPLYPTVTISTPCLIELSELDDGDTSKLSARLMDRTPLCCIKPDNSVVASDYVL